MLQIVILKFLKNDHVLNVVSEICRVIVHHGNVATDNNVNAVLENFAFYFIFTYFLSICLNFEIFQGLVLFSRLYI